MSRDDWPVEFDFRKFMSPVTLQNQGLIAFTGGNKTVTGSSSPGANLLMLNIERVVQHIDFSKKENPRQQIFYLKAYEIWTKHSMGQDDAKLALSKHTSVLLPDLINILIVGGIKQGSSVKNEDLILLNLKDKQIYPLEPPSESIDLSFLQNSTPFVSLKRHTTETPKDIRLTFVPGYQLKDGTFIDHNDQYLLFVSLFNKRFTASKVTPSVSEENLTYFSAFNRSQSAIAIVKSI